MSNFNLKLGLKIDKSELEKFKKQLEKDFANIKVKASGKGKGKGDTSKEVVKASEKLVALQKESLKLTGKDLVSKEKEIKLAKTALDTETKKLRIKELDLKIAKGNALSDRESLTYDKQKLGVLGDKVKIEKIISQTQNKAENDRLKRVNAVHEIEVKIANIKKDKKMMRRGGEAMIGDLKVLQGAINNTTNSFKTLSPQMSRSNKDFSRLQKSVHGTGQNFAVAAGKVLSWTLATSAIFFPIRMFKDMIEEVKALDKALVELNKVTDFTKAELKGVTEEAFALGAQVSKTGVQVVEALAEFSRAGYGIKEAFDLSEQALIMTNIGDGIDDVAEASSALISIMKAFDIEASNSSVILDVLNEVSNNAAVNFDNLTRMLQDNGATMAQTGNSMGETVGLLTGAFEIIRDEKVSTALRTLSLRLQGMNEDMEITPTLASNMADSLKKYADIDVIDLNGDLKSTYEVLNELSQKMGDLSETDLSFIMEDMAGKRQRDSLTAILKNWDSVESAVESATNSFGSAAEENAIYMDSIEAKTNKLNSSFSKLANDTISSDVVKGFIELLTVVVDMIDKVGVLYITIAALILLFPQIIAGFKLLFVTIQSSTFAITKMNVALIAISAVFLIVATAIRNHSKAKEELNKTYKKNIESTKENIDALEGLKEEYLSLIKLESLSGENKTRLAEIEQALSDSYGITTGAIDLQNQSLEEQKKVLEEIEKARVREIRVGIGAAEIHAEESQKRLNSTEDFKDIQSDLKGIYDAEANTKALGLDTKIPKTLAEAKKMYEDNLEILRELKGSESKLSEAYKAYEESFPDSGYSRSEIESIVDKNFIDRSIIAYTGALLDVETIVGELEGNVSSYEEMVEALALYDSPADVIDTYRVSTDELKEYGKVAAEIKSELDELTDIQRKMAEGATLTGEEIITLTTKYPELLDKIEETTDGFKVQSDALETIREEQLKTFEDYLLAQEGLLGVSESDMKGLEGAEESFAKIMQIMEIVRSIDPFEKALESGADYEKMLEDVNKQLDDEVKIHEETIDLYKEKIEKTTELYNRKEDELSAEERLLEIEKARAQLVNAQAEKNVWEFTQDDGWQLVADARAVESAKENLKKLEDKEAEIAREKAFKKEIKLLETAITEEEKAINLLNETMSNLKDSLDNLNDGILSPDVFKNLLIAVMGVVSAGGSITPFSGITSQEDIASRSGEIAGGIIGGSYGGSAMDSAVSVVPDTSIINNTNGDTTSNNGVTYSFAGAVFNVTASNISELISQLQGLTDIQ